MTGTGLPSRAARAAASVEQALAGNPHTPRRPNWTCAHCHGGVPWPCDPARVRLAEEYAGDRPALSTYMGTWLTDALTELPTAPPQELFDRFISWTR